MNMTNSTLSASAELYNLSQGEKLAIGFGVAVVLLCIGCIGYRCFFVATVTKERRKSINVETLEAVAPRRPSLAIRVPG